MQYKTDKEVENLMTENPLFRSAGFYPFKRDILNFILSQRKQDREAIKEDLEIVLDFVERWNKQDKEIKVAQSANNLLSFLDGLEGE